MKIELIDVGYRGYYFEHLEFDLPGVKTLEDLTLDLLREYVVDDLDNYINFHESFLIDERTK